MWLVDGLGEHGAEADLDTTGPGPDNQRWQRRRGAGAAVRIAVTLAPAAVSAAAAIALNAKLSPAATWPGLAVRTVEITIMSLVAMVLVDKAVRRLLPLASLLQLTLVFPDQAPSRFRTALKAGSGRRLAREVEAARSVGLSSQPARAAEQLVLLATAIGDHDRRTRGHSERVRLYAQLLGEQLKLSPEEMSRLQWAALIHDIGKIHVPAEILNKTGKPTAHEWEILQRHPIDGELLAAPVAGWLGEWTHAIGGHHERYDGAGYPRGLAGKDIPRAASIVAIADAFEVMTAVRSYKKAMPLADARAELTSCAGSHFDPATVRAFLSISIADTRRAMGVLGSLAHLPFIGRVTTAAAFAPDVVPIASHAATSAAAVGLGAAAITTAVVVGPSASASPAPPPAVPAAVAPPSAPDEMVDPGAPTTTAPVPEAKVVPAFDATAGRNPDDQPTPEPEKEPRPEKEPKADTKQAKEDADAAAKADKKAAEQAKKDAEAARKAQEEADKKAAEQAKKDAEAARKAQEQAEKEAAEQAKKDAKPTPEPAG